MQLMRAGTLTRIEQVGKIRKPAGSRPETEWKWKRPGVKPDHALSPAVATVDSHNKAGSIRLVREQTACHPFEGFAGGTIGLLPLRHRIAESGRCGLCLLRSCSLAANPLINELDHQRETHGKVNISLLDVFPEPLGDQHDAD